jgi:peroxisomal membrane protein 4
LDSDLLILEAHYCLECTRASSLSSIPPFETRPCQTSISIYTPFTMDALAQQVNNILMEPAYRPLLAILKSARNGAVYGAKVRFPHALVMVFLFRSGTFHEKLRLVYKATRQHAKNLATFAVIYKTCMLLLRIIGPEGSIRSPDAMGGKEGPYDTFLSGAV